MIPYLMNDSHKFIADEIYTKGIRSNARITPPGNRVKINLADGESIRRNLLDLYLADGDERLGYKVGFTSQAVQIAQGINEPEFGFLTKSMELTNQKQIPILGKAMILVEPEICFELTEGFDGNEVSVEEVLAKTSKIYLALEFVESRVGLSSGINNVVADNVGAARILLSEPGLVPADFDFEGTEVNLKVDDQDYNANVSDVLGNPANSIVWLNNRLSKLGKLGGQLGKNDLVMTGSPIKPIPVAKGSTIKAEWDRAGKIEVEMV